MTELASTRSVVFERELPHPSDKIWRALTQGPLIEKWLYSNDFRPAVGHRFQFRGKPRPHWNGIIDSEVLVVEPHERLAYRWNASGEGAADGLNTVVTWTLTSANGGTKVRMEQSGFRSEDETKGPSDGWPRLLTSLERVVGELN